VVQGRFLIYKTHFWVYNVTVFEIKKIQIRKGDYIFFDLDLFVQLLFYLIN